MMSNQQTLQQQRAKQADDDVNSVVGSSSASEYSTVIRSFPALIQTDGLATALAFLQAKGKSQHKSAYQHISGWVMSRVAGQSGDLLGWVQEASTFEYCQATAEALAYTAWLKRFVEAKIS